ncbi:MAG: rod shape-determining protein MreC [Verrucomicrobiota bacterium]|nr:rod shape-determining protein MreC [Verrucomicrobiota bacterium]
MRKTSYQIACGIVFVLSLLLLNLPPRAATRAKGWVGHFFLPLFGLQKGLQKIGEKTVDSVLPRSELLNELSTLHQTNQLLRMKLIRLDGVARENARLKAHLLLKLNIRSQSRLAQVVGRDPANWWRTIQIDLGERDGVRVNHPVWAEQGLVGRVIQVGPHRAQVALVGDPSCRVSVKVSETEENGVLTAAPFTAVDPRLVNIIHLPADTAAAPENTVVTSGLSEFFPSNIPVGKIVSVNRSHGSVQTTARVRLSVDSSRLQEVWVMVQPKMAKR